MVGVGTYVAERFPPNTPQRTGSPPMPVIADGQSSWSCQWRFLFTATASRRWTGRGQPKVTLPPGNARARPRAGRPTAPRAFLRSHSTQVPGPATKEISRGKPMPVKRFRWALLCACRRPTPAGFVHATFILAADAVRAGVRHAGSRLSRPMRLSCMARRGAADQCEPTTGRLLAEHRLTAPSQRHRDESQYVTPGHPPWLW